MSAFISGSELAHKPVMNLSVIALDYDGTIARGDVPVWLINSNQVKDQVSNMLGRTDPGGRVHFPQWFDSEGAPIDIDWLYTQLTTEVRDSRGWSNPSRRKNEALDLLAYAVAFLRHPDIRILQIDWSDPPGWAQVDWDANDLVFSTADGMRFAPEASGEPGPSLSDLADSLG